ncbi:MAG: hypothetical protein A2X84_11850 [Desulfuromonadaceae bacterium GWC2_58_13]|nr:MAG: hypothetical protein A2X84_11850 [Desulfuromonadaceae bacterium GWC2_58_13]
MPFTGFHRFFAALLVAIYLLAGGGLARAVIWCVNESGHSHVEFNPAGNCQVSCDSAGDRPTAPERTTLNENSGEQTCQDVVLLSSQAKDSRLSKLTPPPSSALSLLPPARRTLTAFNLPAARLRVAELPPPMALAALRSVVLLN